jgi:hypothetical protein
VIAPPSLTYYHPPVLLERQGTQKMKSVQTQEQKQKTVVEGANYHYNDTALFKFLGVVLAFAVFLVGWHFVSDVIHEVVVIAVGFVLLVLLCAAMYSVYHLLFMHHHERKQMQGKSHFFLVGDQVIGDETTLEYRHFYVPPPDRMMLPGKPRDEYQTPPQNITSDDIIAMEVKKMSDNGMTVKEIADTSEDLTPWKVRKYLGKTGR